SSARAGDPNNALSMPRVISASAGLLGNLARLTWALQGVGSITRENYWSPIPCEPSGRKGSWWRAGRYGSIFLGRNWVLGALQQLAQPPARRPVPRSRASLRTRATGVRANETGRI